MFFAVFLQALLVMERILHLFLYLFVSSKRTPLKQFSARLVWASVFDVIALVVTLPLQIVFVLLSGVAANAYLGVILLVLVGGLAMAADSSSAMTAYLVNAYNGGLGVALNKFVVTPALYLELLLSDFVPLWNSVTWLIGRILLQSIEVLEQSIDVLPDLASNLALAFSALGQSSASATNKLVRCWAYNAAVPDMDCVGNTLATSLDVMTPAVYVQGAFANAHTIIGNTCAPLLVPLNAVVYPLLDVNLYMAVHSIINFVWSAVCGTWIQRSQRCGYAYAGGFSAGERAVMCMPDFSVAIDFWQGCVASFGQLLDNWLDIILLLVERAVGLDSSAGCEAVNVGVAVAWRSASEMLDDTLPLQVVGLTRTMYAITDGKGTVYRSLVQGSKTLVASGNWPFQIEPRYGVAAVRHAQMLDADYSGDGRTGLLGCRCLDHDAGIEVICASVPFLSTVNDSPDAYNVSTVHRIHFQSEFMPLHMRCERTAIKVTSLRFSRKRMSLGRSSGFDSGFRDDFDSMGEFGDKMADSAADAAIYIAPQCSLADTDPACVPDTISCFPFCMGLHIAGQNGKNISVYNARRWRETVNVQQLDCLTEAVVQDDSCEGDTPNAYSDAFGFEYRGPCVLGTGTCVGNEHVATAVPVTQLEADPILDQIAASAPYIRLGSQPFVMAGDIMLFIEPATEADPAILVVSRLFDNNRGDYTLSNEQLTLANAAVRVPVFACNTPSDNSCRVEALRGGGVTEPEADRLDPLRSHAVAVSEWGVHWADNPDNSVLATQLEYCSQGRVATSVIVPSSFRRPRIWTLRATRLSLSGRLQIISAPPPLEEAELTSYMVVPDWLGPDTPCTRQVNLKIVDIEYLNAENLLVTVLRAAPKDYDLSSGTVCPGCSYEYSFYFLHPNLHRCMEPTESAEDTFFTCWRSEAEGMFLPTNVPKLTTAGFGTLCPALRRMPQLGSLGAHVGMAGMETLRLILNVVFAIPAGLIAGVDFYKLRVDSVTFHPVLDSSGTVLFRVDEILMHIDKAAFHLTNSFVRIMAFFDEAPGYAAVQPIVVGTAKIMQFAGDSILLEGPLLELFGPAKQIPVAQSLESAGAGLDAAPMAGKESKVLTTVKGAMMAVSSSFRYVVRLFKPLSTRLLKNRCQACRAGLVAGAALNIANFLPSLLAETQGDFERSFTNNLRLQCDGLATVFGTTNPIATSLRHACVLTPDTLDAVMEVLLVLTVNYPAVACACTETQERNPAHVIESECLLKSVATRNRVDMQEIRKSAIDNTARGSMCFAIMDATNRRLERAFDPVFARMARFTKEFARSIDYVVVGIFDWNDGGNCNNFAASPYVVSIVPYPIDYFSGCVHTFDCRARCMTEMQAFEEALAFATAMHTAPPTFRATQAVRVESRFFREEEIMNNEHLPPFEILAVLELLPSACRVICNSAHVKNRCAAVAGPAVGPDSAAALGTAYYCIPADFGTSVFAYSVDVSRPLPAGAAEDMFFATADGVLSGTLDTVMVLSRRPGAASLTLVTPRGQLLTLSSTRDPANHEPTTDPGVFVSLERVWVLPATEEGRDTVVAYVGGLQHTESDAPPSMTCARFDLPMNFDDLSALSNSLQPRACYADVDTLLPLTAEPICMSATCETLVFVPTGRGSVAPVEHVTFDLSLDAFGDREPFQTASGTSASVGSRIGVDKAQALFRTQQGAVAKNHRRLSAWAVGRWRSLGDEEAESGIAFDFLLSQPTTDTSSITSWLVNLRLALATGAAFEASAATSLERVENIEVEIECSIDNCIGCHPTGPRQNAFEDLQAKCFVAQQCGVTQCAGTLVNLRKPLCNLGKVLASPTDLFRVVLMGTWTAISETIIHTVELSHARRQLHQFKWADETSMALVCNAKDSLTESITTISAIIGGADLWREQLHRDGAFMRGFQIDPRYHARVIMTVAAMSSLLTNMALAPLYVAMAAQQSVGCALNDTIIVIQEAVDPTGANTRIELGSRRLAEARGDLVGVCLSKSMGSVMQELDADNAVRTGVGYRISDAVTRITELLTRSAFEPSVHILDATLTYFVGVVHGFQDMLQTIDWYHCKPPVANVASVSSCVCGDHEFSIVNARKTGTASTFDFWCSGPLIFSSTLENDILIWNEFSLSELLAVPGVEEFAECISTSRECTPPQSDIVQKLQRQGVEVLQVITRCRSNFQEKKWDDGVLTLGTFPRDMWQQGLLEDSDNTRDGFSSLRDQLVRKSQAGVIDTLELSASLWQCLHNSASAVQWNHRCLELYVVPELGLRSKDEYFMYTPAVSTSFTDTDACQTFTGKAKQVSTFNTATHSATAWSPGSSNPLPVANYHLAKFASAQSRVASAEAKLQALMDEIITPYLASTTAGLNLKNVETESWTLEGDHLHQLMDCVIQGPYAAADLHSSFRMSDNKPFPVPQYHRGDPTSRAFSDGDGTGGSEARRQIMQGARASLNEQSQPTLKAAAEDVLRQIRSQFSLLDNLQCRCPPGSELPASVSCCQGVSSLADIDFQTKDILREDWNLADETLGPIFDRIATSDMLTRDIWASAKYTQPTSRTFTESERFELHHAFVFDNSNPVREYSREEVIGDMRSHTLWHQCTALLSTAFFTLPLREGHEEVDGETAYDATAGPETTGQYGESERYTHSIERAVEHLMQRSKRDSPHFWTHVHRYVPSDSVWCEDLGGPSSTDHAARSTNIFDHAQAASVFGAYTVAFNSDSVKGPRVNEVVYPGHLRCLCGWVNADQTCATVWSGGTCDEWALDSNTDAVLREDWTALCITGIVASRQDFFVHLRVMEEGGNEEWMQHCVDATPAAHWGLIDPDGVSDWLQENPSTTSFGMLHELATHGPGGLRFGLLGAQTDTLVDYVRRQKVLRSEHSQANFAWKHTIAQPYCDGSIASLLTSLGSDLSKHFPDVFFPMAHSIEEAPISAYCSRYTIEIAILRVLEIVEGGAVSDDARLASAVLEQRLLVATWRQRCIAQQQQVGICELRGVYDVRPPDDEYAPPSTCAFTMGDVSGLPGGCEFHYITAQCLVYCRVPGQSKGNFYDPCLCGSGCTAGTIHAFTAAGCTAISPDVRHFVTSETVRLQSMHWPGEVPGDEAATNKEALDALLKTLPVGSASVDEAALLASMKTHVEASLVKSNAAEGQPPASMYCDDLFDYWDGTAQHPVGYHPSTACACENTRVRGFKSWMSAAADNGLRQPWRVDPRRFRNFTQFSAAYGSAHLTCDRSVYGRQGVPLNPFFLESRWNSARAADPAVPVPPDQDTLADMTMMGQNPAAAEARAQFDTAAQDASHATGLVRRWWRASRTESSRQGEADTEWPSLDTGYGLSGEHDESRTSICAFPPLRTCLTDAQCASPELSAGSLQCLLAPADDTGEQSGVCAAVDTCYLHRHCDGDLLCAGTGLCVEPRLYFVSDLLHDTTLELYSDGGCSTDTWGASTFQHVPSFARDHGMCKFRDWYHYQDTISTREGVGMVADRPARRTDDRETSTLFARGMLQVQAHACDRSFQHSSYHSCATDVPALRSYNSDTEADHDYFTQTWRRDGGEVQTPVCSMINVENKAASGFLDPYFHVTADGVSEDTLAHANTDITSCELMNTCIEPSFSIEDVSNIPRQVLVASLSERGVFEFSGTTRRYTHDDARSCYGFGYKVVTNDIEQCLVDRYTNPLLDVLFTDLSSHVPAEADRFSGLIAVRENTLQERWAVLTHHCPKAFDNSFDQFKELFYMTTMPYLPENRGSVGDLLNVLLLQIFNSYNGLQTLAQYIDDSRCAQHLVTSLEAVKALALRPQETPYAAFRPEDPPAPGRALYLFHERSPVQISLEWVWKCVITAQGQEQGGVALDWRVRVTRAMASGAADLSCANADDAWMSRPDKVSIRKKLQVDSHLLDIVDPGKPIVSNLLSEIRKTVSVALTAIGISAWPDLFCMLSARGDVRNTPCLTPMDVPKDECWLPYGRNRADALEADVGGGLYAQVEDILLGQADVNLGFQTIDSLLSANVLEERIGDLESLIDANVNFVPSLHFPALDQYIRDNDPPPHVKLTASTGNDKQPDVLRVSEASKTGDLYTEHFAQDDSIAGVSSCNEYTAPFSRVPVSAIKAGAGVAYRLTEPQFSVETGSVPRAVVNILSTKARNDMAYVKLQHSLSEPQALFLVLQVFRYELYNSQSFGVGNLHRVMPWNTPTTDLTLEVNNAREYNQYIASLEGPCGTLLEQKETNLQHQRLRDCVSHFRRKRGWTLPSQSVVRLHVSKKLLQAPFYPAHGPRDTERFLDTLFSEEISNKPADFICARRGAETLLLNPYWASDFDFGDMDTPACDTRLLQASQMRQVSAECLTLTAEESCANRFPGYYQVVSDPHKMNPACQIRNQIRAETTLQRPLCQETPPPTDSCRSTHGTLRGSRGQFAPNLYETYAVTSVEEGFWNSSNAIFRGDRFSTERQDTLSALRLLPTDIGGHYLQFVVDLDNIYLLCADLHHDTPTEQCAHSVSAWKAHIDEFWSLQHDLQQSRWPATGTATPDWKCPLRWQDAWSSSGREYDVRVPNGARNEIRFRHLTTDKFYAHPTVISVNPLTDMTAARYIADSHLCLHGESAEGLEAGCKGVAVLAEVLQALRVEGVVGKTATPWTTVRRLGKSCSAILDWPHGSYEMFDHSDTDAKLFDGQCSALTRLPVFATRYEQRVSARGTPAVVFPGANDPGGVCHMGRISRIRDSAAPSSVNDCSRTGNVLKCTGFSAQGVWEQDWALEESAPPLAPRVARRQLCAACEAHHQQYIVDSTAEPVAATAGPAQLSVGLPRSFSSERLLAQHLRRVVCPSPGTDGLCPALAQATAASLSWNVGAFAPSLLALADASGPTSADDSSLWNRDWIFCDQTESLPDGEARCSGSMTRTEWADPQTRTTQCLAHIKSKVDGKSAPISFCKLSDDTSALCQRVQAWNAQVLQILCEAAGLPECPRFGFFYTPTAYSVVNREFAADTVDSFYARVLPTETCPLREESEESAADEALLATCASRSVSFVRAILETARSFVHKFFEIIYYFVMFWVQMLKLLVLLFSGGSIEAAVTGTFDYMGREANILMKYAQLLIETLGDTLAIMTEAILKLFWEDGLGKAIFDLINGLCEAVNTLHKVIVRDGICVFIYNIGVTLNALCGVFDGDLDFDDGTCGNDLVQWGTSGECAADRVPLECVAGSEYEWYPEQIVLPVATRCWSTYTTFFGDTGPLSCTPADTCRLSPLSSERVKCSLCPETGAGYDQFGCDAGLKMCTCSVPRTVASLCTSNLECSHADAACKYIDSEMALSSSAVQCTVCSSAPVCFVPAGATSGTCGCPLIDMPFSQCRRDEHKQSVYPRQFNSLCFLDRDEANARSQEFTADVEGLVTTPCNLLLPSASWCMQIRQNNAAVLGGFYVVGFDTIATGSTLQRAFGRRLLAIDNASTTPPLPPSRDWLQVHTHDGLCLDAFAAAARNDSSLFNATFTQCAAVFEASAVTAIHLSTHYNVSLPPCTFCSLTDAMASWVSLEGLPFEAWGVVVQRHTALPVLLASAQRYNGNWRGTYEALRHDVAGYAAQAHAHIFPSTRAEREALRRFFVKMPPPTPSRRLLDTGALVTYFDTLQRQLFDPALTRSYEQLLATSWQSRLPPLSQEQLAAWQRQWPPSFTLGEDTCDVALDWVRLAQQAAASVPLAKSVALRRAEECKGPLASRGSSTLCRPPSVLADAWPRLLDSTTVFNETSPASSVFLTSLIVDAAFTLIEFVGFSRVAVSDVIFSIIETVRTQFRCDLDALQTCSKWRVNILMGATVVFVFYALFFGVCNTFGVTLLAVVVTPLYPFFVWHVCYGYQLFCAPTIPACFLQDMRATMQSLFPPQLVFPPSLLLDTPACRGAADAAVLLPQCVLPCSAEPLGYTSWHVVAAWLAAEVGVTDLVADAAAWAPLPDLAPLQDALPLKRLDLRQGGDLMWGNRLCAVLHGYRVLPYLFLLFVAAFLIMTLTRYVLTCVLALAGVVSKLGAHELTPTEHEDDEEGGRERKKRV